MTQPGFAAANASLFKLQYPQSVAVFSTYEEAQRAVDHLADNNFPVANLAIVGTDLRLMERVTGRRTWATVLQQGVLSGISTGLMVALFMIVLLPSQSFLGQLLLALTIGIVIGVVFAAIGYAMSRGQRDFTSVTQTVATKYEVLSEHKVAAQARQLLASAPGARAAQFDPAAQAAPGYPAAAQASDQPQQPASDPAPQYPWQQPGYPPPPPPADQRD